MREHMGLYRGKEKRKNNWVKGTLISFCPHQLLGLDGRVFIMEIHEYISKPVLTEVDPDTVGECTGLPDKNGKLIFEGDICDHHVQGDILVSRGVIKWDAKNGRWVHRLNTMEPELWMFNPSAWEIVGNIRDNPELLESEE